MAEPHSTTTIISNTAATVAITSGVTQSSFAQSLLSASFDQILSGRFHWQLSDVVTLACSAIVICNFVLTRLEKRRGNSA
ncbi:hypothetical protein [Vibrio quintilis]|uniref:Uncharacterized protein n=1 Tax=Vibrio quintilis TaxID=1117707 RepID=A0A1M7YYP3_9VIBR|nr:hypothetical protein [Vibrio quintilis]SHO57758.1 hypothetical protein VQ7734_03528 [Vibrio quintilis]